MPEHFDVLVVGGGPAGIFAAVTAALKGGKGRRVAILEHNHVLGRKLGKTGNGRCNLTNRNVSLERYRGEDVRFLHNVLPRFGSAELLAWFEERGVEFKEEEGGCIFPVTDQASTIADVLKEEVEGRRVAVFLGMRVEAASREGNGPFAVRCAGGKSFTARALVIAAGGPAYPQLGATEDGAALAKSFGHSVVPFAPSLVALETADRSLFDLQGVKARVELKAYQGPSVRPSRERSHSRESGNPGAKASAHVQALSPGRPVASVTDELLFTHYGVSGPAVLHASGFVASSLPGTETRLAVNFFPGLARPEAERKILSLWKRSPRRSLGNSLMGILPKKLPPVLFRNVLGLDAEKASDAVTKEERARIAGVLTGLELKVAGTRGYREAQAASGGVRTAEVVAATMESKLARGLHFAGEVLDITGDCGGFNLQFAFSSGRLAGLALQT